MTVLDRALDEGEQALTRLAGKQLLKLIREPLISAIAGHLGPDDPSTRKKVADFIDTDLGEGLVAGLISLMLLALPKGMLPAQVQGLTSEMRVVALLGIGDAAADLLMGPLRAVICGLFTPEVINALPVEPSRVKVNVEVNNTEPAYSSTR